MQWVEDTTILQTGPGGPPHSSFVSFTMIRSFTVLASLIALSVPLGLGGRRSPSCEHEAPEPYLFTGHLAHENPQKGRRQKELEFQESGCATPFSGT